MRNGWVLVIVLAVGCNSQPAAGPQGSVPKANPNSAQPFPVEPPPETVTNPEYTSWSKVPVGTTVVRRVTTAANDAPEKTVTTSTFKLLECSSTVVTITQQDTTRRYDGVVFENPPERVTIPASMPLAPGIKKADFGKPSGDETQETLTINGVQYATRCYSGKGSNEGGQMNAQTWIADNVPGRLVKAIVVTPAIGKTVTTELIEFRKPTEAAPKPTP